MRIRIKTRLRRLGLAFALLGVARSSAQQHREHRIYSDVEYIEEAGDLVGSELELDVDGSHVDGVLRFYEGACGTPVSVSGVLHHNQIHLSGRDGTYGDLEIAGTIGGQVLHGTVRWREARYPNHQN